MNKTKSGNYANRTALITGGSSGIGNSLVKKFTEERIKTSFADVAAPEVLSPEAIFFDTDITKRDQIDVLYQKVMKATGVPDILVCNAGRGIHEKLAEGDPELWGQIFELNVLGALRVIRAFLPDMIANGFGDIVFVSSVSSKQPYQGGAIYAASKASIDVVAETLRLEVQPNLRVTTISPGVVDTRFFENIIHGTQTPENIGYGAIEPEAIADAIFYAISRPKGVVLNNITIRPVAQP